MSTATDPRPASPLDRWIPQPDVRERHAVVVRAPASLVFATARAFPMRSLGPVRAIIALRALLLGGRARPAPPRGLVEECLALGWGALEEEPGRLFCAGASCRPWLADVVFAPADPERFAAGGEPGSVRIAWTLETEAISAERTRLATETRVVCADAAARRRFRPYWRRVRPGIVLIRLLILRAVRRRAERAFLGRTAHPAFDSFASSGSGPPERE